MLGRVCGRRPFGPALIGSSLSLLLLILFLSGFHTIPCRGEGESNSWGFLCRMVSFRKAHLMSTAPRSMK